MPDQDKNTFHIEGRVKKAVESPRDGGVEYKIVVEVDGAAYNSADPYKKGCLEIAARVTGGGDPWAALARNKLYAFDGTIEHVHDDESERRVLRATDARRIDKVDHGSVKWDDCMRPVEWYDEEGNVPPLWLEEDGGACG